MAQIFSLRITRDISCNEVTCFGINDTRIQKTFCDFSSRQLLERTLLFKIQEAFWNVLAVINNYKPLKIKYVIAIKNLHYEWYLKILPKLHEPLGENNWILSFTAGSEVFEMFCAFTVFVVVFVILVRSAIRVLLSVQEKRRLWGRDVKK